MHLSHAGITNPYTPIRKEHLYLALMGGEKKKWKEV